MYVKVVNGVATAYPLSQLSKDNPGVSFPSPTPDSVLAAYSVYPVTSTSVPQCADAEVIEQHGYVQNSDGNWVANWVIRAATADELVQKNAARDLQRQAAYQAEADPLFFKSQRGEATTEEWLGKVAEIKLRFPTITG